MRRDVFACEITENMEVEVFDGTSHTSYNSISDFVDFLSQRRGQTYSLCYMRDLQVDMDNVIYELDRRHCMMTDKVNMTKVSESSVYSAMCTDSTAYTLRFCLDGCKPVEMRDIRNLYTGWDDEDIIDAAGRDDWGEACFEAYAAACDIISRQVPVTPSSAAYRNFRSMYKDKFEDNMPRLTEEQDDFVRRAYFGGIILPNCVKDSNEVFDMLPRLNYGKYGELMDNTGFMLDHDENGRFYYKGTVDGAGYVVDKTSMYPSYMRNEYLPIGKGEFVDVEEFIGHIDRMLDEDELVSHYGSMCGGTPSKDYCMDIERSNYYFVKATMRIQLKEGHVPCIKFPRAAAFDCTNYITRMECEDTFYLTEYDYMLVCENYDVEYEEIEQVLKFRTEKGVFRKYVDKWFKVKHDNDHDKLRRKLAKLMINSLSGKFAQYARKYYVSPMVVDGMISHCDMENEKYESIENEDGELMSVNDKYIPIAAAITAYGRYELVGYANSNYDNLYGGDTDSLFLKAIPSNIPIGNELGEYKVEHEFDFSKFVGKKTYILHDRNGEYVIKGSGMCKEVKDNIIKFAKEAGELFDDESFGYCIAFSEGMKYSGRTCIMRDKGRTYKRNDGMFSVKGMHTVNFRRIEKYEEVDTEVCGEVVTHNEFVGYEFKEVRLDARRPAWADDEDEFLPFPVR